MEAMNDKYPPEYVAAIAAKVIEDVYTGSLYARPVVTDEQTDLVAKRDVLKRALQKAKCNVEFREQSLARRATFTPVERPWESKRRRVAREKLEEMQGRVACAKHDIGLIDVWALQREIEKVEAALVGVEARAVESTAKVTPEDLVAAAAAMSGAGQ